MDKATTESKVTVHDSKTGQFVTVHGLGALRNEKFSVNKNIDLTKPIEQQILDQIRKTGA